ncbi:MAG: LysR family transcriptional regulator [Gammaproteobacteria bacterium]|nr:LysR family transcriptional regulator [Gammaproteobacteria bacterium]
MTTRHLPTVRQLQYLLALAEHGHFGRAAASCHVSQSAFSVAIRALESTLAVRLVDRTNKRVTVTAVGREIIARARQCLRDVEDLVDAAQGHSEPLTGPLTLGVIPTIAPFLLPRVLPAIRRQFPRLELYLREDLTQRIYAELMNGTIDVMLVALPYELQGVEEMPLFRDHFRLAAREDTRLLDPARYDPRRLPAESVLLLEDGHCLRNHALTACRLRDPGRVSRFSATSLPTLLQMVDADLGVTYLPEMAEGTPLLKGTRIRTYPLTDTSYREIGLVWRKGSARGPEFRQLGELIVAHRA